MHAIFMCTKVRGVWKDAAVLLPKGADTEKHSIDFLEELIYRNRSVTMESILVIAWGIWKKRCEIIHGSQNVAKGKNDISFASVKWALNMVEEFKLASSKMKVKCDLTQVQKLIKQAGDIWIVFTDASFNIEKGASAYGAVVSDANSCLIMNDSGYLGIMDSPLEAEIEAIAMGVRMMDIKAKLRVLFLTDCKEAISVIKGEETLANQSGYTLEKIQQVRKKYKNWTFRYIPREYNCAAHYLAKTMHSPVDSPDWINSRVKDSLQDVWSLFRIGTILL